MFIPPSAFDAAGVAVTELNALEPKGILPRFDDAPNPLVAPPIPPVDDNAADPRPLEAVGFPRGVA